MLSDKEVSREKEGIMTHFNAGRAMTRIIAGLAAGAATISVAACGSSSSNTPSAQSGPVQIEVWGWDKNAHIAIDKFNASQKEVKINYVLQASNTAIQQNFRNAFTAKSKLPDWVQGFAPLTTNVSNGWAEDISQSIQTILPKYTNAAKANAQLNGVYYGFPSVAAGTYGMVNTDVLSKYGVQAPKTWTDVIALGQKMKAGGGKVYNLAGEDPSGFMQLAQVAGANWFKTSGDTWVVNMLDPGTQKAASVVQQLIDDNLVSNQTYQDRAALYNFFDSGNLGFISLAYWSSVGYKTNMPKTSGKWEAVPFPAIDSSSKAKVPGIVSQVSFIPKGTSRAHQDAVMKWVNWQNTPVGYEAGRDPDTHTLGVPAGLTAKANLDPMKYINEAIPNKFYSDDIQAKQVILSATQNVMGGFNLGPNYDAWFPELQDQWGKAVARQITLKQALKTTQDFIIQDLKSKGINVKAA